MTNHTRESLITLLQSLEKPNRPELRKHVSDSVWMPIFGSFTNFKQCAGLSPNNSEKQFTSHIVKNSKSTTPIINSIKNELIEYADKFKIENTNRFKTVLTIADVHSKSADLFTVNTFLDASVRTNASHIVIAGDLFDFSHFSKYNHDPRSYSALDELEWVHSFLTKLRTLNPQAEITLIFGNHCRRIFTHLAEQSPYFSDILAKFSKITPSSILKLDELQINAVCSSDFSVYKESRNKPDNNFTVIGDTLLIGHYPTVKKHGIPSIFGHNHRHLTFPDYNYTYGSFYHLQLGAACIIDASYTEDFHHWTNGFCYSIVDTQRKRVIHDYCDTTGYIAVFGGKVYERTA